MPARQETLTQNDPNATQNTEISRNFLVWKF